MFLEKRVHYLKLTLSVISIELPNGGQVNCMCHEINWEEIGYGIRSSH